MKILKRKVRDIIDPDRDLGHVDKHGRKDDEAVSNAASVPEPAPTPAETIGSQQPPPSPPSSSSEPTIESHRSPASQPSVINTAKDPSANPSAHPPSSQHLEEETADTRRPISSAPGRRDVPNLETQPLPESESESESESQLASNPEPRTDPSPRIGKEAANPITAKPTKTVNPTNFQEIAKEKFHIDASRPQMEAKGNLNHGVEKERERRGTSGVCEDCV